MGGSVTYGFSGNPDSVSIQTGSYTIPAGKYAYVTAFCNSGETFSIDGTNVLDPDSATGNGGTSSSVSFGGGGGTAFTVPSNAYFQGRIVITSGAGWTAGSVALAVGAHDITMGAGQALSSGGGAGVASWAGAYVYQSNHNASVTASYWVPTGTVLNTSGGRYVVQLFS